VYYHLFPISSLSLAAGIPVHIITGSGAPGGADTIAIKLVGARKAEATLKRGGKEIGKSEAEVSSDGTVSHVKSKGKTPDGKEYSADSVYDKQ